MSASGESQYDDAFTIQMVEDEHVNEFNYVAGMVPFLRNLIKDVSRGVCLEEILRLITDSLTIWRGFVTHIL